MSLGPTCQFSGCDVGARESVEHPDYGTIRVCENHADLWDSAE